MNHFNLPYQNVQFHVWCMVFDGQTTTPMFQFERKKEIKCFALHLTLLLMFPGLVLVSSSSVRNRQHLLNS